MSHAGDRDVGRLSDHRCGGVAVLGESAGLLPLQGNPARMVVASGRVRVVPATCAAASRSPGGDAGRARHAGFNADHRCARTGVQRTRHPSSGNRRGVRFDTARGVRGRMGQQVDVPPALGTGDRPGRLRAPARRHDDGASDDGGNRPGREGDSGTDGWPRLVRRLQRGDGAADRTILQGRARLPRSPPLGSPLSLRRTPGVRRLRPLGAALHGAITRRGRSSRPAPPMSRPGWTACWSPGS